MIHLVNEQPFLKILGQKNHLVIADLHLGVNLKWFKKGIRMRRDEEIQEIRGIIKSESIDSLVLLGDVKEHIFEVKQSIKELFIQLFSLVKEVHITRGNHDPILDTHEFPNVVMHPFEGMILEERETKIGLLHGHGFPSDAFRNVDVLILGHVHPAIRITTGRYSRLQKTWLLFSQKRKPRRVIVMPTGNPLLIGSPVTELNPRIPPLDKLGIDLEKFEVILLNGINLGRIKDLKNGAGGEIRTRELLRD